MPARPWLAAVLALAMLAAGCASTRQRAPVPATHGHPASADPPTPAAAAAAAAGAEPSAAALMICDPDIAGKVTLALALATTPPRRATWDGELYTCTYRLPLGLLVVSVREAPTKPAAALHFEALRPRLGATEPLLGLGERAYGTRTGAVVVLKDATTLRVDATGLPAVFGRQRQKRTDFANEIAANILGCWTGHH